MDTLRMKDWGFALLVLLTGCAAHVQYLPMADTGLALPPVQTGGDVLVGVALSGGGSRAALFGAAGLEALAALRVGEEGRSLLERVSYISSVSGGSLAASYFAMHKPSRNTLVLTRQGRLTEEYRAFFDRYADAMGQNFELPVELRQFFKLRWFNPSQRATSLAEVLDDRFLKNRTLKDLSEREANGDSPRLLINSTLYNNGRRFVITTLPQEALDYNFLERLEVGMSRSVSTRSVHTSLPPSLVRAKAHITPMTFSSPEIKADWRRVPLSSAAVASASFPPLIGPITVQVGESPTYWHVGDGGLFDNQGTESLVQVMLKQLEDGKAKRALIIALDSSYPFSVGSEQLDDSDKGFKVFVEDPSRIVGIMEQRANTYQAMTWHILQRTGSPVLPNPSTIKVIVLRHTDAEWNKNLSDLPEACKAERVKWTSKRIETHVAEIPTLLRIKSECDKQLLVTAATKVVTQHKDEIRSFLDATSTPAP